MQYEIYSAYSILYQFFDSLTFGMKLFIRMCSVGINTLNGKWWRCSHRMTYECVSVC